MNRPVLNLPLRSKMIDDYVWDDYHGWIARDETLNEDSNITDTMETAQ